MDYPTCIIGAGKLGSALALAFHKLSDLKYIVDISDIARNKAKILLPDFNSIISNFSEIVDIPQFVFLTVNDDLIEKTTEDLAKTFGEQLKNKYIIHCSGSLPLAVLDPCKKYGAITSSIHPYQTFYRLSDDILQDIAWTIRSDNNTEILEQLIKQIGGNPYVIKDDDTLLSLYHGSAVVSSNFMTALISLAKEIANLANIDANEFMPAIIKTTVENGFNSDEFPLTGPYARGDIKTIERHLEALSEYPQLKKTYIYLALATLEQISIHKTLNEKSISEIRLLLSKSLFEC